MLLHFTAATRRHPFTFTHSFLSLHPAHTLRAPRSIGLLVASIRLDRARQDAMQPAHLVLLLPSWPDLLTRHQLLVLAHWRIMLPLHIQCLPSRGIPPLGPLLPRPLQPVSPKPDRPLSQHRNASSSLSSTHPNYHCSRVLLTISSLLRLFINPEQSNLPSGYRQPSVVTSAEEASWRREGGREGRVPLFHEAPAQRGFEV